jgi:hypothetical protein
VHIRLGTKAELSASGTSAGPSLSPRASNPGPAALLAGAGGALSDWDPEHSRSLRLRLAAAAGGRAAAPALRPGNSSVFQVPSHWPHWRHAADGRAADSDCIASLASRHRASDTGTSQYGSSAPPRAPARRSTRRLGSSSGRRRRPLRYSLVVPAAHGGTCRLRTPAAVRRRACRACREPEKHRAKHKIAVPPAAYYY